MNLGTIPLHCSRQYLEQLKESWNLFGLAVENHSSGGGVALLWRKEVDVTVRSFSLNHIDAEVVLPGEHFRWRFTGLYGFPERHMRARSWDLIRTLHSSSSLPWLIGGDFNEVLADEEKSGGLVRPPGYVNAFRDCLSDCDLSDLGFVGRRFTWSNNRVEPETVRCRLDRVCANPGWRVYAPAAKVEHLNFPGSDHIPILLRIREFRGLSGQRRRRPWRFNAHWVRKDECEKIVRDGWEAVAAPDCFDRLFEGIEACQMGLQHWAKDVNQNPRKNIEQLRKRLADLQADVQTVETKEEVKRVQGELEKAYSDDDIYWRQRSKVLWAREGDRNTSFFHQRASARKSKNSITGLLDKNGVWCEQAREVETVITDYFGELFQTTNPDVTVIDEVLAQVDSRVDPDLAANLIVPYSADEVFSALSQMAPLKSPGPDGLPAIFFQKYWNIIGSDIVTCVLNFLNSHHIPHALNYTFIVLIPKVDQPKRIMDFRPISLCNVIYKIGSKAIANRIKPILNDVISHTQSAFVHGRLITDNVLVAYEMNHFIRCHTLGKRAYMALKLDVSKAYDRIEWLFLERILAKLGFPHELVALIMLCVSTVSFSFLLNGAHFGSLTPNRGIRQGDPLSPYLFICCVEGFIQMVEKAVGSGQLKGIRIAPSAPIVSNLCFADDTVLFSQATASEATTIRSLLDKYATASGQIINMEKSTLVFSPNIRQTDAQAISNILSFQVVDRFERYLGLPTHVGKSKAAVFTFLKDRLWSRVQGWKEKHLSLAGREVLIKSILQAIPTYVMSCFILPNSIIVEAERIIRRFWWGSKKSKGIHWLAWNKMCRPKSEGGMGFRDLESFNLSLLAKQGWRIMMNPELLISRILKAKYFPRSSFMLAEEGDRPSLTWRSLLKARPFLEKGIRWRVGNGASIPIWGASWLLSEGSGKLITTRSIHSPHPDAVGDLINWSRGEWDLAKISQHIWPCDIDRILQVPFGSPSSPDTMYWSCSKNGRFSVRSCYHHILGIRALSATSGSGEAVHLSSTEWKWIWGLHLPPKIRTFIWRTSNEILPVKVALMRRNLGGDPFCPRCNVEVETVVHTLFECVACSSIWQSNEFNLTPLPPGKCFIEWFRYLRKMLEPDKFVIAMVMCWRIWWLRNQTIHGDKENLEEDTYAWAMHFLDAYVTAQHPRLRRAQHRISVWTAPPEGVIKLNFDIGFLQTSFHQIGLVARDSSGRCVGWRARKMVGRPPVVNGEAKAALECLHMAQERGWRRIQIEGDCLSIVSAIQNHLDDGFLSYGDTIRTLLSLANSFDFFSCDYVRRSGNMLAHAIAHFPISISGCVDADELPADLASIY